MWFNSLAFSLADRRWELDCEMSHYQAKITEIIRFGSVCAHTGREMSIDRRTSLRRPACFRCSSRRARLGEPSHQVVESETMVFKIGEGNTDWPLQRQQLTFFSYPLARPCEGMVLSWVLTCVCCHRWGRRQRPVNVHFVRSGDLDVHHWLQVPWIGVIWTA